MRRAPQSSPSSPDPSARAGVGFIQLRRNAMETAVARSNRRISHGQHITASNLNAFLNRQSPTIDTGSDEPNILQGPWSQQDGGMDDGMEEAA